MKTKRCNKSVATKAACAKRLLVEVGVVKYMMYNLSGLVEFTFALNIGNGSTFLHSSSIGVKKLGSNEFYELAFDYDGATDDMINQIENIGNMPNDAASFLFDVIYKYSKNGYDIFLDNKLIVPANYEDALLIKCDLIDIKKETIQ